MPVGENPIRLDGIPKRFGSKPMFSDEALENFLGPWFGRIGGFLSGGQGQRHCLGMEKFLLELGQEPLMR